MNDPQQSVSSQQNGFRDILAAYYDDSGEFDDLPSATDASAGLISLGFIGSALRRGMLVWLALALIGLLVGVGLALDRSHARLHGHDHGADRQPLGIPRAPSCRLMPLSRRAPRSRRPLSRNSGYSRRLPAFSGRTPWWLGQPPRY